MLSEYQMSAALMSMDIDVAIKAVTRKPELAIDILHDLKKRKDKIINDKGYRETRYGATCGIFSS